MTKQYQWLFVSMLRCTGVAFLSLALSAPATAASLATTMVKQLNSAPTFTAEGVVEAIRGSVIAPQVPGSITALAVKVGDHVKAGQLLARIDTRMATQQAITNQAQVMAAQAQLSAARKEYERKNRLYEKQYISQAALERAESDYKTAEAQTKAQLAQTGLSDVQTGLHTINAPYAGVIAEVMTEVGGMAMPGQPLLAIYDPSEFRVTVNVPQSQLANLKAGASVEVQIPAAAEACRKLSSTHMTILPMVDPVSNMVQVRLTLPQRLTSLSPGMFARAMLPVEAVKGAGQILVPAKSVIRRSELVAIYVVDQQGRPQLRQVRLGRQQGENVEVFAGLNVGELVALDPIAAANFK
ncbi:MAG: efflux RND transporter periplasmic adaptor subunit [Methylotenera sp.]|nr:efflux RND transporter periplasmic adaptor subunit [Methylotenera sp.]MSP99427.1 efflux RND transporter periplasmic adaptor subunit [Methylotenera sp.]